MHLHRLIINQPFLPIQPASSHVQPIDTFRICISAYALNRYSKTVRIIRTEKHEDIAQFNQTMQMIIRVEDRFHG